MNRTRLDFVIRPRSVRLKVGLTLTAIILIAGCGFSAGGADERAAIETHWRNEVGDGPKLKISSISSRGKSSDYLVKELFETRWRPCPVAGTAAVVSIEDELLKTDIDYLYVFKDGKVIGQYMTFKRK